MSDTTFVLQNALNNLDDLKVMHSVGDRMPIRDRRFPGSRTVPFNTNNRFRGISFLTRVYHKLSKRTLRTADVTI